ncbi:hypothetical protein [Chitinophaga sp. Cy-1792]|uniref:hypothetical protein n=1 Tax=Chitinophaga sp. Cy-1792 TaxID=2608339 RepID=UPI0014223764|nr:hypothetical protein [Chitinophaga sp. Cy-1792]NIG54570.1 hypothetical protein [Chitinophaga sp. Cy-1792]
MVVKIKPKYLMKLQWYLIVPGILISTLSFLFLKMSVEDVLTLNCFVMTAGICGMFYLNRNELMLLNVTPEDKLDLSFINKSFLFKRHDLLLEKSQYEAVQQADIIQLKMNGKLIANVRRNSVTDADWNQVAAYFSK